MTRGLVRAGIDRIRLSAHGGRPVPKAGVPGEAAAGVVTRKLTAPIRGGEHLPPFERRAPRYIEFEP